MHTFSSVQVLCLIYTSVLSLSPTFSLGPYSREAGVACVILWLVIELANPNGIFRSPSKITIATLFFLAYTILSALAVKGPEAVRTSLQMMIAIFFALPGESSKSNPLQARLPFWLVLAFALFWQTNTLIELASNPYAARIISHNSLQAEKLTLRGVGGFALVYFSVYLGPLLFALIRFGRPIKKQGLPVLFRQIPILALPFLSISFGISILLVLNAGYTFAMASTAFALLALVFPLLTKSLWHFLAFTIIAISIIFLSSMPLSYVLYQAKPIFAGTEYEKKINDIARSLETGRALNTVEGRLVLYSASVESFASSPLFGDLRGREVSGEHSAVLDTFAKWGIVGGLPFLFILTSFPLSLGASGRTKYFTIPLTITVLTLCMVNPLAACHGVAIFLLSPFVCACIKSRDQDASMSRELPSHTQRMAITHLPGFPYAKSRLSD